MTSKPGIAWRSAREKQYYGRAMAMVEQRLMAAAGAHCGELERACKATLFAGGKRVRPLLTLICVGRDEEPSERVLRGAAAVELLHMASLVHDDVLDRAELRRGRPTIVCEYGVETAVSAGNLLLARAFTELVGAGVAEAVDVLSAAAVRLAEGEVLQRDEAHVVTLTQADQERRCERKTADLFAAACRLGAVLAGRGEEVTAALAEYGRLIGLAFQVFDDILDCSGDEANTGKHPGADVRDGTITLPLIFALEVHPEIAPLLAAPDPDDATVSRILSAVAASGALARAREVAMRYIESAHDVLAACPDPVQRDLLTKVAAQVVDRYS